MMFLNVHAYENMQVHEAVVFPVLRSKFFVSKPKLLLSSSMVFPPAFHMTHSYSKGLLRKQKGQDQPLGRRRLTAQASCTSSTARDGSCCSVCRTAQHSSCSSSLTDGTQLPTSGGCCCCCCCCCCWVLVGSFSRASSRALLLAATTVLLGFVYVVEEVWVVWAGNAMSSASLLLHLCTCTAKGAAVL